MNRAVLALPGRRVLFLDTGTDMAAARTPAGIKRFTAIAEAITRRVNPGSPRSKAVLRKLGI